MDLHAEIRKMVAEETRYLRHYVGEVVSTSDPLARGRVQVKVPHLGWEAGQAMPWCWPRYRAGVTVPPVGAQVDIWFAGGDPSRPVYGGQAAEMAGQTPTQFDGRASTAVLYEDPATGDYVTYDASEKALVASVGTKLTLTVNGNKVVADSAGLVIEDKHGNKVTADSAGLKLEDKNGNDVTMGAASVTVNGNLEVLR